MDLINYCIIAGTSVLFLIGCLFHLSENDIFSMKTVKKFESLIYVLMAEIVLDCLFALFEGQEIESCVLYLLKAIELIMNPMLAFFVFEIFYDEENDEQDRFMPKIRILIITLVTVNAILQAATVLFGLEFFYIDDNNMYHRGPLIGIYVAILLSAILALIVGIAIFSSKTQSIMKATLVAFTAILVSSIGLRNFFPNNNYDFLCISVAIPFLLVYYSHVTLRIDPLTRLMNRQAFSRVKERVDYMTVVIMIDANFFKQINDAHGHECGDHVMQLLAVAIKEAYEEDAYCFRYGGDEFCIILKPKVYNRLIKKTHYDVYAMAENLMRRLDDTIVKKIEEKDEDSEYLEYGVSQGYGIYDPKKKHKTPFDKVIEMADENMYCNKKLFKEQFTEPVWAENYSVRKRIVHDLTTQQEPPIKQQNQP